MKTTNQYATLRAEMARAGISIGQLADRIGVSRNQLSRALSGTTPIRLQEANAIRRLFPGMSLEVLFDLNEA